MNKILSILILVFITTNIVIAQTTQINKNGSSESHTSLTAKISYNFISVNNIKMWVGNDGIGSHDPATDGNGFYWPGGENAKKSSIFSDGLVFGARVNDEIFFGGSLHSSTLQGGKIIDNQPDDPSLEKYRVYKINRLWEELPPGPERESGKKDYLEWPMEDGAPYEDLNGDGKPTPGIDKPKFLGDETLWFVSNDLAYQPPTEYPPTTFSQPLGIELQTTVFSNKALNILGDVVFKKFKLINKGNKYLKDMYISYFSDPDIGDAGDDYVGCDTLLNLGYAWNSDNMDGNGSGSTYGNQPPAVGYTLLVGPTTEGNLSDSAFKNGQWEKGLINLQMGSFMTNFYCWNCDPLPYDPTQYYNILQGLTAQGEKFLDPVTGKETNKLLSGDPVSGNGWYEGEGWPNGPAGGDRRFYLSSGPFNFAPGDTQEVVYAIHIARGTSNVSSIGFLREQSKALKDFYYSEFSKPETITKVQNIPDEYRLYQNYPNPFNPGTVINYELPYGSNVILRVFDVLGNEIETLVNEYKPAGEYEVSWDGRNFSNGVYFYQLDAGGFVMTRKMVLLK